MIYGQPLTAEGIQDRVYRLHYNKGQNRTDMFSRTGGLAGAAVCAARFGTSGTSLLGGAAIGSTAAILAHISTYEGAEKGLQTGPANMVEELKHSD